jgi:hypothetical protein
VAKRITLLGIVVEETSIPVHYMLFETPQPKTEKLL